MATAIADLTEQEDLEALRERLEEAGALDLAEELARLPADRMAVPFRLLAKDRALEVFEALDPARGRRAAGLGCGPAAAHATRGPERTTARGRQRPRTD